MFSVVFNSHSPVPEIVGQAASLIRQGKIIAFPSDTIYGLLAGFWPGMPEKLALIKQRPEKKPFLLVLPEQYDFLQLVEPPDPRAADFANRHWPGKNTLIFQRKQELFYPPTDKIALRKPCRSDNPFFHALLAELQGPLLAPSLNISGEPPLQTMDQIENTFGSQIDAVFFQTDFVPGQASNIYDLTSWPIEQLR